MAWFLAMRAIQRLNEPRAGSNTSCFFQSVTKTSCTTSSAVPSSTTRAASVNTNAA